METKLGRIADEVTKEGYSRNHEENIRSLVIRLKNKSYKPQPVKRVYIQKDNGKKRPLGIAAYEDKIVQLGLKKILEAVYEPKFQENMYGFRLWHDLYYRKRGRGESFLVAFADDFITGFEYKSEAERYYRES